MALAVQAFALHISECGLRSVVTAEAGAEPAVIPGLLPRYLRLRLAVCAFVSTFTLVLTDLLRPELTGLMAVLCTSLFAIALHLDWIALVTDRPFAAGGLLLVRPLAFVTLLFALAPILDAPLHIAMVFTLAWWVSAAVTWMLRRPQGAQGELPTKGRLIVLGLPLMATTLLNQAQLSLDLLAVGVLFGSATAGSYYLAAAIAAAGMVFANATGQLATARMARWRDDPAGLRQVLRRELIASLFMGLGIAAAITWLTPLLLPWLFAPEFAPVGWLVLFFLPWFVLQSLSILMQGALAATRQQGRISMGNLALLMALPPAMLLAWWLANMTGQPTWFALARGFAEAARLAVLMAGGRLPMPQARRSAAPRHSAH